MSARDFFLLSLISVAWGFNFIVTKWAVSGAGGAFDGVPPMMFALLRFIGVAALLIPFLGPMPKRFGLVAAYALCMGAVHFSLMYIGVKLTNPSTAAVVFPIYVPLTTILSVLLLGEVVRFWRGAGIALAGVGVVVLGFEPGAMAANPGVLAVVGGALAAAVGAILNKRLAGELTPLQSQAWVGVLALPALSAATLLFETGQVDAVVAGGWLLWAAVAYTVVIVGIFGHVQYFAIMSRNPATLVTPLALMTNLWGVVLGVVLLSDPVTWRLVLGGGLTLIGVLLVAMRPSRKVAVDRAPGETAR